MCTYIQTRAQVRIVMPKYYGGSQEAMVEVLEAIRRCGCSFLVAGRVMEGEYRTARAVEAPPGYEGALYLARFGFLGGRRRRRWCCCFCEVVELSN